MPDPAAESFVSFIPSSTDGLSFAQATIFFFFFEVADATACPDLQPCLRSIRIETGTPAAVPDTLREVVLDILKHDAGSFEAHRGNRPTVQTDQDGA